MINTRFRLTFYLKIEKKGWTNTPLSIFERFDKNRKEWYGLTNSLKIESKLIKRID